MTRNLVICIHGVTPKQGESLEEMLENFMIDEVYDGKSKAHYEVLYVKDGAEVHVHRPPAKK